MWTSASDWNQNPLKHFQPASRPQLVIQYLHALLNCFYFYNRTMTKPAERRRDAGWFGAMWEQVELWTAKPLHVRFLVHLWCSSGIGTPMNSPSPSSELRRGNGIGQAEEEEEDLAGPGWCRKASALLHWDLEPEKWVVTLQITVRSREDHQECKRGWFYRSFGSFAGHLQQTRRIKTKVLESHREGTLDRTLGEKLLLLPTGGARINTTPSCCI